MRRLLVVLAAAICLGALIAPSAATAQPSHVYQPGAHPFGATYGQWQARWFEWFIEIPAPLSPLFDDTGEHCGVNQSGQVWFLGPTALPGTTTRACTVPTGTGLYVLGLGNECSNVEPPPFFGDTEADLRACAAEGFEAFFGDATVSISVDGVDVGDLDRYRTQTPLFGYTLPADNVYGLPAGTTATKAISDGNAVMVKPLKPGFHMIAVHINAPALGGVVDLIYNLTVVPRGHLH